jgi:thioredoxin-related protein
MPKTWMNFPALLVALLLPFMLQAATKKAPLTGIGVFETPSWFKPSFLDLRQDISEATVAEKRLMIFFHQNGCPYCAETINNNFSQKHIVDYTRKHFDVVEINMWGDREVTDLFGKSLTEKQFATQVKVWFTPTMLFFDEQGKVILRVNGYFPPHQLLAALQYVAEKKEDTMSFPEYYKKASPPSASGKLHKEPFFGKPPYDFPKRDGAKPLIVLFEQKDCVGCDTLHADILKRPATLEQVKRFDVYQLDRWSDTPVVTPAGKKTTARKWANELNILYVPAAIFFDGGKEVLRIESMFKAFHTQSITDYIASGAYKQEPSFQRFLSARADQLRERGIAIDLWK